ncbi:MAG: HAD family hydrolase [Candidatus Bathyarchaeota archaeon]|nr:HAD family hydrolase [Candidatus Bathyarchaeota archaeon]
MSGRQAGCVSLIKAVTFDLWNTLIVDKDYTDMRVNCLADALRKMNTPRRYGEIREAYDETHKYAHKVWRSRSENYRSLTTKERLNYILERLSAKLTEDLKAKVTKEFKEIALSDPPPLAENVQETLEFLSSRYRMAIISDSGITPGKVLRKILSGHRVLRFFDAAVFSDENGYNKPHRTMFEKALTRLGVQPSEAVHIGDLLETDIAGAKEVGMKAVWLNNTGKVNVGPHKPDCEIKTFPEIIGALEGI